MDRYEGKSFLKLLDFYVLKSIEQIKPEDLEALTRIEPKLREVYGAQGDWFAIVAGEMDFPAELPGHIQALWLSYSEHAQQQGVVADPVQFTHSFIDENFPDI